MKHETKPAVSQVVSWHCFFVQIYSLYMSECVILSGDHDLFGLLQSPY